MIPVQVQFSLTPSTASASYVMQQPVPTLVWDVTGLTRVHVYDDQQHFDSTKPAGITEVCPGPQTPNPPAPNTCAAPSGTYVYTLDAYDASNRLVLHRTLKLTIG